LAASLLARIPAYQYFGRVEGIRSVRRTDRGIRIALDGLVAGLRNAE
jgi:hypothetical protein